MGELPVAATLMDWAFWALSPQPFWLATKSFLQIRTDGDGALGRGELDGVVEEVFEDEGQEAFVALEGVGVFGEFDAHLELFFGELGGVAAGEGIANELQVDAVGTNEAAGILDAGKVEEVLHHELQPQDMVVDYLDAATDSVEIVGAGVFDGFDGGADGGQGGAELVRGVGGEVGLHLEGTGDLGNVAED